MSYQEIVEKTKTLTKEQKQSLAYFLLFSTISEEQRKEYEELLHSKNKKVSNPLSHFSDWKNTLSSDLKISDDEFYN